MFASEILEQAIHNIQGKAVERDQPNGERTIPTVVRIFEAATGIKLTPTQGWLFMLCVKVARSQAGGYVPDDYADMAAYASLMGEEESLSPHNKPF